MGKSREMFEVVRQEELYLNNLNIAQLQSLLPASNPYVNEIILKLIKEKQYGKF